MGETMSDTAETTTSVGRVPGWGRFVDATNPVWRVGAAVSVVAAAVAEVYALGARGIDVSLELDGEAIPPGGFATVTLAFSAIGTVLAVVIARWAKRPARTFLVTTLVLTAVSLVPPLTTSNAETSTRVMLALAHVVVAAVVIPVLVLRLSREAR